MRSTRCRTGISDFRCKTVEKVSDAYKYLFEDIPEIVPSQDQTSQVQKSKKQKETIKQQSSVNQPLIPFKPAGVAKATQSKLTVDQVAKAKLTNASGIFDKEGYEATKKYLSENNLDYTIDWELSNDSGLVLIDNNTGKVVISYRGTDLNQPNDWITGLAMLKSTESSDPVFIKAKSQLDQVINEYGSPSELLGFSRGGTIAISLGNEYNIHTTSYNPFINKNLLTAPSNDLHTIIRTTTDPISIGANLGKFNVIQVNPIGNSLNPIYNHELNQFIDTSTRSPPQIENVQKFVESTGKAQSELITIKDMTQAVNEGKTFSEFLQEFSPVDIQGGALSSRIYDGSNFTNFWKDSGGTFNLQEQSHLLTSPKGESGTTGTTSQHRSEFSKLTPMEQDVKIQDISNVHVKALEQFTKMLEPEAQVQAIIEPTPSILTEQLSAVSLGSGLLGGYLGQKITTAVDPKQKLTQTGDEALSGFLGGGIGAAIVGGSIAPAAIAGSAGYLAGAETAKALQKYGYSSEASSTIGGTVGGITASTAIGLGAVGAAALSGAEIGSVLSPETFGISVLVGGAIGGLAGLASSLYEDVFGSTPPPPGPVEQNYVPEKIIKGVLRAPAYKHPELGQPVPEPVTEPVPVPPPQPRPVQIGTISVL
jgi:hypothetical protein